MIIKVNGIPIKFKNGIAKKQVPEVIRVHDTTDLRNIKIITGEFASVSELFYVAKEHPDLQFVILADDEVPITTNTPVNCHIGVCIKSVDELYKLTSLVSCDAQVKFLCIHETVVDYLVKNQLNLNMSAIDWVEINRDNSRKTKKDSKTTQEDTLTVWINTLPEIVCYVAQSERLGRRIKYVHSASSTGNVSVYGYECIEGLAGIVVRKKV